MAEMWRPLPATPGSARHRGRGWGSAHGPTSRSTAGRGHTSDRQDRSIRFARSPARWAEKNRLARPSLAPNAPEPLGALTGGFRSDPLPLPFPLPLPSARPGSRTAGGGAGAGAGGGRIGSTIRTRNALRGRLVLGAEHDDEDVGHRWSEHVLSFLRRGGAGQGASALHAGAADRRTRAWHGAAHHPGRSPCRHQQRLRAGSALRLPERQVDEGGKVRLRGWLGRHHRGRRSRRRGRMRGRIPRRSDTRMRRLGRGRMGCDGRGGEGDSAARPRSPHRSPSGRRQSLVPLLPTTATTRPTSRPFRSPPTPATTSKHLLPRRMAAKVKAKVVAERAAEVDHAELATVPGELRA